jgi:hypothetical protein
VNRAVIVDSGPLVTFADEADPRKPAVEAILTNEPGEFVIPAPATAEVDHLLGSRIGSASRRAFLKDLADGRFTVACLELEDYRTMEALEHKYSALNLGLVDLSVIVLAKRFDTTRLLTFDERDFRAVTPLQGGAFELLPADA